MSQFAKFVFTCLLLMALAQVSLFAQSALDNPFAVFNGDKPKGDVDSVLIYRYPYEGDATLYVYNKKGQFVEYDLYRYWINPDFGTRNRDTMKKIYVYNTAGKLVSSGSGKIAYKYLPTKFGYVIRTNYYDSTKVFEMRFNKLGQMIQSGIYKSKDTKYQQTGNYDYQYNNKGYLIKKIDYYDSGRTDTTTYRYDDKGNLVEAKRAGRGYPRISTYKYNNYDKMNNWTQQAIHFVNGSGEDTISHDDTIRRRITYYK